MTKSKYARIMKNGLPNKCSFVINDTRQMINQAYPFQRKMYYVDLCGNSKPLVYESYMNLGTGTFQNDWKNIGGRKTTVLGSFFTNTQTFDFSKRNESYMHARQRILDATKSNGDNRYAGKSAHSVSATSLQLFGLQKTNNNASQNKKYMHISPYVSSWGCPSVRPEDYWILENLAKNGPSLVVNYGEKSKMEDINECSY